GLSSQIFSSPESAVHTASEKAFFTEFARAVAECERCQNPISLLDSLDLFPHLFNDSHPFVASPKTRFPVRFVAAIKPQVGAADAGVRDSYKRVGRLLDFRIWNTFYANISFAVINRCFHAEP